VRGWRIAYAAASWLFLGGVIVQIFLAGAGLFELTDWTIHAGLGWGLGSAPLLLLVLALVARADRRTTLLTVGLLVASVLQPELAAARHSAPLIAAFHPLNAFVIASLAWLVARRATDTVRQDAAAAGREKAPSADTPRFD
jgi:hypothetical protein